jgi:transposase
MKNINIFSKGDIDMQARYHDYTPDQTYFIQISPGEIRTNNPLVKAIDDFVDTHVSLALFSEKRGNAYIGAPAVHAGMMLKVLFYCYAAGTYSSREIERRTGWDQNAIYLSGNRQVDHSTICRFIEKYPVELRHVFTLMVYVLKKIGLVSYELVAIDGSKIQGYGSKEFTGNISEFRERKKSIEKKIDRLMKETCQSRDRIERKIERCRCNLEKINSFLSDVDRSNAPEDTHTRVNLTDRDARLVKDNGRIYLGYNCQTAADADYDIIVGCQVTNNASERPQLVPMINEVKKHQMESQPDMKIVADAGYFSSENIEYAEKHSIDLYLPEGKHEGGLQKKRKTAGRITSKDCVLTTDNGTKQLLCPGGYTAQTVDPVHDHGNYFYRFYVPTSYCQYCEKRNRCHRTFRPGKSKRFNVKREYCDSQLARQCMREKLTKPEGKKIYNRRSCIIEHVFGEIKEYKKFRRFYHRGLEKVNTLWTLVCIAYNFRKLSRYGDTV